MRLTAKCLSHKANHFQTRHLATTSELEPSHPSFRSILILSCQLLLVFQVVSFLQISLIGIFFSPICVTYFTPIILCDHPNIGSLVTSWCIGIPAQFFEP
jgi:hypothetical protein